MEMIPLSDCGKPLTHIAQSINSTLLAQACLVTLVQRQTVLPLVIAGAPERHLYDPKLYSFLRQCAELLQSHYLLSISFEPVPGTDSPPLVLEYRHSRHVQIPHAEHSDFFILLSLFYKQNVGLEPALVQAAQNLIQKHAALFAEACSAHARSLKTESACESIIGHSTSVRKVRAMIAQVAATNSDVLLVGETGTGKELVARTIHQHSLRKESAFIPVDCVAIPSNLMESELFGFEKGAFTGASGMKHGLFELAHNGTLFLDEISELEINLQAKLLRVLQERQFRRLGGERLISVDIRVIAAMNQRPVKAMSEGNLRKDLFYRLNIIPIHVPALRHRAEDIPSLVEHFLEKAIRKNRLQPKTFAPEALTLLQNYHWPGNVRQLQNVVERLAVLSPRAVISAQDLPANYYSSRRGANTHLTFNEAKKRHLAAFEKEYFAKLLAETSFNITQAARVAGISDRTVYRMLQRYGSLRDVIAPVEKT